MREILYCTLIGVLLALCTTLAHAGSPSTPSPSLEGPVVVDVSIAINKIYEVESVDETYVIDGYLLLGWQDSRLARPGDADRSEPIRYENAGVDDVLGTEIWWPNIEFINIVGGRSTPSRRLMISADGRVVYHERFYATFFTDMDFHRYPFDGQSFDIHIESFSYDSRTVEFSTHEGSESQPVSDSWDLATPKISTTIEHYPDIDAMLQMAGSSGYYSRYSVTIGGRRKSGYFIWQFFFPLFLIIGTSCSVFWMSELSDRLSTAFTLMLTVVAFNFYVTNLLPPLPYNTLIEVVITSGYLEITTSIVLIIAAHVLENNGKAIRARQLLATSRWLMPASYLLTLIVIAVAFLAV